MVSYKVGVVFSELTTKQYAWSGWQITTKHKGIIQNKDTSFSVKNIRKNANNFESLSGQRTVSGGQFDWGGRLLNGNGGVQRFPLNG